MNRTLKTMLAKLCQETQLPRIDVLPLALLRARCTPRASGYFPIKIRYGRPPPVIKRLTGDPQQIGDLEKSNYCLNLGQIFRRMIRENLERTPIMLGNWVHPCQPGEMVWVKDWKKEPRRPVWTGPHMVVLATPTLVKVPGIVPWIHHTRVNMAAASYDKDAWETVQDSKNSLKVRCQR